MIYWRYLLTKPKSGQKWPPKCYKKGMWSVSTKNNFLQFTVWCGRRLFWYCLVFAHKKSNSTFRIDDWIIIIIGFNSQIIYFWVHTMKVNVVIIILICHWPFSSMFWLWMAYCKIFSSASYKLDIFAIMPQLLYKKHHPSHSQQYKTTKWPSTLPLKHWCSRELPSHQLCSEMFKPWFR